VAERSERIIIILLSTGLSGLGVPYILPVGLWALAALSTITFGQRVLAVRRAVGPGAPGQAGGGPGPAGTGPDRTGPVGTEPDRTGPDGMGLDSTGEGTG
jgi:CDP-diacylglycerol---glycerol-3-phosphate 3-phosphatidyltransferase